jgi:hypothetical protein
MVVIALLVQVGAAAASPAVPVVRCHTRFGIVQPKPPAIPRRLDVRGHPASVSGLVAYTNTVTFLLGPANWACKSLVGADGTSSMIVWPQGNREPGPHTNEAGVKLDAAPDCSSCQAELVCPFMAAVAASFDFPCTGGIPAGEDVTRLRHDLVAFEDPPGIAGSGDPSGGNDPANGVVGWAGTSRGAFRAICTLPAQEHRVCTTVLDDAIARYY